MSTKNLRRMLDHYRRITDTGFAPREIQLIDAIQELEAIERAAKAMNEAKLDREKLRTTARLMQSIAKDAP